MYLRKSIRSYKGGSYTNYLLVESIHTANGPRQKTVCSLGDLGPRHPRFGSRSGLRAPWEHDALLNVRRRVLPCLG
jgi:hypothetical protein